MTRQEIDELIARLDIRVKADKIRCENCGFKGDFEFKTVKIGNNFKKVAICPKCKRLIWSETEKAREKEEAEEDEDEEEEEGMEDYADEDEDFFYG